MRWPTVLRGSSTTILARHNRLGAEFGGHDPGVCANTNVGLSLAQLGRNTRSGRTASNADLRSLGSSTSQRAWPLRSTAAIQIHTDHGRSRRGPAFGRAAPRGRRKIRSAATARGQRLHVRLGEVTRRRISQLGSRPWNRNSRALSRMGSIPQLYAGLLAAARLSTGEAAHALEPIDAILPTFTEPGVGVYLPELHRLRGECLLRSRSAAVRRSRPGISIGHCLRQAAEARCCFGCARPSAWLTLRR